MAVLAYAADRAMDMHAAVKESVNNIMTRLYSP